MVSQYICIGQKKECNKGINIQWRFYRYNDTQGAKRKIRVIKE